MALDTREIGKMVKKLMGHFIMRKVRNTSILKGIGMKMEKCPDMDFYNIGMVPIQKELGRMAKKRGRSRDIEKTGRLCLLFDIELLMSAKS